MFQEIGKFHIILLSSFLYKKIGTKINIKWDGNKWWAYKARMTTHANKKTMDAHAAMVFTEVTITRLLLGGISWWGHHVIGRAYIATLISWSGSL
jgi:hypothetical protein